jgi:hypothetical protein
MDSLDTDSRLVKREGAKCQTSTTSGLLSLGLLRSESSVPARVAVRSREPGLLLAMLGGLIMYLTLTREQRR